MAEGGSRKAVKQKKVKARNVYRGAPVVQFAQVEIDKLAQITDADIDAAKAKIDPMVAALLDAQPMEKK